MLTVQTGQNSIDQIGQSEYNEIDQCGLKGCGNLIDVLAKVDKDKKRRIINSAMREFGSKGFDLSSTNNIVKDAKISKGLLFHYFKTKQALFDYIQDFTFTTMIDRIKELSSSWDSDLINRVLQVTKLKMEVVKEYPDLYEFGVQVYSKMSIEDVRKLIEKYDMQLYNNMFVEGIDNKRFKVDLDPELTRATIQRALEKKSEEILAKFKQGYVCSMDEMYEDVQEYSKFLRKAFYK